jgi:hypothetical protein
MMISPLLFLLYFACLPSASAWIFSWHNPDGKLLAVQDDVAQDCKSMDNPKGNVFDWTPQEGHWCIFLYTNTDCKEPSDGHTCKTYPWSDHVSGQHILSFKVKNYTSDIESSSISASESATDTKSSPTPTVVIPTTTDAIDAASSSSVTSASSSADKKRTISGGAIAGIVIGVLAAVAIAGMLIVFLIWRRRKNAAQSSTTAQTNATPAMAELSSPVEELELPISTKSGFRELHGSAVASEIGPGAERHELSGTEINTDKKD